MSVLQVVFWIHYLVLLGPALEMERGRPSGGRKIRIGSDPLFRFQYRHQQVTAELQGILFCGNRVYGGVLATAKRPPMKKYIVELTAEEQRALGLLVRVGKAAAYKIRHASILLKADANGPAWNDEEIAEAFGCHVTTVENVRRRFVLDGFEAVGRRNTRTDPHAGESPTAFRLRVPTLWRCERVHDVRTARSMASSEGNRFEKACRLG